MIMTSSFYFHTIVFLLLITVYTKKPKLQSHRRRFGLWRRRLNFGFGIPTTGVINPAQLQIRNNCPIGSIYLGQCESSLCIYGAVCTSGSCCAFTVVSPTKPVSPVANRCPKCNDCCKTCPKCNDCCKTCPKCNDCCPRTHVPDCSALTCPKCDDCCPMTAEPENPALTCPECDDCCPTTAEPNCPTLPECPTPTCPTGMIKDGVCDEQRPCENPASICIGKSCCTHCDVGYSFGVCKNDDEECRSFDHENGLSHKCTNGQCCPVCDHGVPNGICRGGNGCGREEDGYKCDIRNNLCCPFCGGKTEGECKESHQCTNPEEYKCNQRNNLCCQVCKDSNAFPISMCKEDGSCPRRYKCQTDANICCPVCYSTMTFPLSMCVRGRCQPRFNCETHANICCLPGDCNNGRKLSGDCGPFYSCSGSSSCQQNINRCCPYGSR